MRCARRNSILHELERIEERLFALRAAGRKYNVPVDDLAALARRYEADLGLIDAGAARLAVLEADALAAVTRYREAAKALSAKRARAAAALDKAVNAELKPLKLERAQFTTQIEAADEGPDGLRTCRVLGAYQSRHPARVR